MHTPEHFYVQMDRSIYTYIVSMVTMAVSDDCYILILERALEEQTGAEAAAVYDWIAKSYV